MLSLAGAGGQPARSYAATIFRASFRPPAASSFCLPSDDIGDPVEAEPELQQTYTVWVNAVVGRNFPSHGFPAIMGLEEAPMLDETVREWETKLRKEERRIGRQEGKIAGMRDVLLGQMTLRFGRLPATVRRQVEEISSLQELRRLGRRILRAQSLQEMGLG